MESKKTTFWLVSLNKKNPLRKGGKQTTRKLKRPGKSPTNTRSINEQTRGNEPNGNQARTDIILNDKN